MKPHVLIALDILGDRQLQRITEALNGWGTWEAISEGTPGEIYEKKLATSEVVVGWPRAEWILSSGVKFLQLPSAGYDPYVKKGLAHKSDLVVSNARGVYSIPVAEHCIAMMMALTRRIPEHVKDKLERKWNLQHPYHVVTGATACIVGLGDIGTELARRCLGLGMNVTGIRRSSHKTHELIKTIYPLEQLKDAVAEADHVFSILPGGPETQHLFKGEIFDAMRKGAYFYNVGRGNSVDEEALAERLRRGQLSGAGLDVFQQEPLHVNSPLWEFDNVLITPHAAGRADDEAERLCDLIVKNIRNYRTGQPLENVIHLA